jgi:hypothetical protein
MGNEEHAEVIADADGAGSASGWQPTTGSELLGLMQRSKLSDEGQSQVTKQAAQALGSGIHPHGSGPQRRTGLVVGHVQSGKTLSFTSVIAMAHDNRLRLVILLTGTKTNLHQQTTERLGRDLNTGRDQSPWLVLANPSNTTGNRDEVAAVLHEPAPAAESNPFFNWQQSDRTALITVMKNTTRIDKVRDLILALPGRGIDLSKLSVLVIDDEADQAGLNTKAASDDEEPSATYRAIRDLRDALPRHTYLEYTATPQAPLLLNVLDTLSPDFVVVLKAGEGYTGGEAFFVLGYSRFVRQISDKEAADALGDHPTGPPESLKAALASYLIAGILMSARRTLPASMLVHPSQTKDVHDRFARWVRTMLSQWAEDLEEAGDLAENLVDSYLRPAYNDLSGQKATDEEFRLIQPAVEAMIPQIQVRVVNSAVETNAIDFKNHPFWILVGGNKLDRGYTVEGLVTTYMPRGIGGGQADTIQQRARFFGYKQKFEDLCRAWLTSSPAHQYKRYVEHESHLRRSLAELTTTGESLSTWRRQMLFDPRMKPCRAGVIGMPFVRDRVRGNSWIRIDHIYGNRHRADVNRALVDHIIAAYGTHRTSDSLDPRVENPTTSFEMSMTAFLDEFLASWEHGYEDAVVNTVSLLLSARLDEQPDLRVRVYFMRDGLRRERKLMSGTKVLNLQEGRRPGYLGTRATRSGHRAGHAVTSPIEAVFDGLETPASGYNVSTWSDADEFRIGKTEDGHAVLITPADPDPDPPSQLKRLRLAPRVHLRFSDGAEARDEYVGLVEFSADDPSLIRHFLSVAAMLVELLGSDPEPGDVSKAMRRLVRLFEPQKSNRGSIIGLWGELLMISSSDDLPHLVDCWHADADDRFDFAASGSRLEVKTTTGLNRVHRFRLHQLTPIDDTEVHVASIMTTRTDAGTSLRDLIARIQEDLAGDAASQVKLYEQVTEVLGGDWDGADTRFDENQALASLRVFDAVAVPCVGEVPSQVLSVEMTVDCSSVPPTSDARTGFAAILPAT